LNLTDIEELVWRHLGFHASGQKLDHRLQQIRDDANWSLGEVLRQGPFIWHYVKESSFDLVSGTSVYTLDDFCKKVIGSMWTEDTQAHDIDMVAAGQLDSSGAKNSSASYLSTGPFEIAPYPCLSAPVTRGTDASVTEGATTVTTSGGAFTAAMVGSRIRLNGEDYDFSIQAFTNSNSIELGHSWDTSVTRAYRARIAGIGVTGVGSGLSTVKWEVTPAGTMRVVVRPTPTAAKTIYYRYRRMHERLLNADDVIDLPEDYHDVIGWGTLMRQAYFTKDWKAYGVAKSHYQEGMVRIKRDGFPVHGLQRHMRYRSTFSTGPSARTSISDMISSRGS